MSSAATSAPMAPRTEHDERVAIVLVATDGTPRSDGALRVAMQRARERHSRLEVLTVLPTEPAAVPDASQTLWNQASLQRREAVREVVLAQIARTGGDPGTLPVTLLEGNPAFAIARIAIERHAALVVVGLGRHRIQDRLFSDETALKLARISRVPVLAVPAEATTPPQHAVVAADFSDLSPRAAQAAVEAVGDEGRVDLVHAMRYLHQGAFPIEGKDPYQQWAEEQLEALAKSVIAPHGVRIVQATVRGRPADALLSYASDVGADLIVTGTHGGGFASRTLLGSVTAALLRGATCTLLTVPRDPLPSLAPSREPVRDALPPAEGSWAALLVEFTRRNAGRRTILEVDDLEIGAQAQERGFPLIAALYDARDHRLQIMLGDSAVEGRHLSRSIGNVTGVGLLSDGHGRDAALCIEHGPSQTLLSFAS